MSLETAKVIENKNIQGEFFLLVLDSKEIAKAARPGQFINIRVSNSNDPLLRRPFSIYDADPTTGKLSVIYFVKGRGTEMLKTLVAGADVSVTGPHGNEFPVLGQNILLVGGGFGVAPLSLLAKRNPDKNFYAAVGGRSKVNILCSDDLNKHSKEVVINTDDGSLGEKGLITVGVSSLLKKHKIDSIVTVGPIPMMRAVALIAEKVGVPCFVSMEERMSCAVGACFGCAVKTKHGMKRVCADGPIFNAGDIEW